jgi:hypothetical protein
MGKDDHILKNWINRGRFTSGPLGRTFKRRRRVKEYFGVNEREANARLISQVDLSAWIELKGRYQ